MGILKKYELGRVEVAFLIVILVAVLGAGAYAWKTGKDKESSVQSFADCISAGGILMESYPEQCSINGKTWSNPDQVAVEPLEPYVAADSEIAFQELPVGLQDAIRTKLTQDCSAEITQHGDTVYTYAVATREKYVEDKYAIVALSCGTGSSAGLYAVKDGAWTFVSTTQDVWQCAPLVEFSIPRSYIAECYEGESQAPVANPVQ